MSLRINSALWMLFASLNFALLNTLVKYLSNEFSLSQIIFFRSFFAIVFILPWLLNTGLLSLKTKSYKLQLTRSTVALAAMYLWFFSISKIPASVSSYLQLRAEAGPHAHQQVEPRFRWRLLRYQFRRALSKQACVDFLSLP